MNLMKWNTLQQEQISLGHQSGLSRRQIRLYAKHRYNFLQMQEIRTALEDGIEMKSVRRMCRPWLSDTEMEAIRLKLMRHETIQTGTGLGKICACAALIVLGAALITDGYIRAADHTSLTLTGPSAVLEQGESFEPMKYVASYSDNADSLSLPSGVDTSRPGVQAAVYRLKAGSEEITRILMITIEEKTD